MLAQERQTIILEMLHKHNIIKISDIVSRFRISNLTARRDLDILQDQNLVRRIYGGAILVDHPETASSSASEACSPGKASQRMEIAAIGKQAASMIHEGDIVFLGTGTAVLEVARHMRHLSNVTIITNSLAVINELAATDNPIFVLGGQLDNNEHSINGTSATSMAQTFCANKAFIGCGGLTLEQGISDYSGAVAEVCRIMVQNAAQSILVSGSHKFGSNALSIVCPLSGLSTVITDAGVTPKYREGFQKAGVALQMVQSAEYSAGKAT